MSPSPSVDIILHGDGAFADLALKEGLPERRVVHHGHHFTVAFLEGGMQSGKPSLMLRVDMEDGEVVLVETSLAIWCGVTAALRGKWPAFVNEHLPPEVAP